METVKKKIALIALDYDPTAIKVAEQGFMLAGAAHAEVILLHVISDPVYYSSTEYSPIMGYVDYHEIEAVQLENIEGLRNASHLFLDKFKHKLGDKAIQTLVKEGDIAEQILDTAREIHADVIILGSHSHKWLEDIVMGSVTKRVMQHTKTPLLIIPTKKPV